MSSISVSDSTKADFNELKPEDDTHDEFQQELHSVYRAYNGEPVDIEQLAEELAQTLIPQTEIAAYRGASEAIDE